MATIVSESVAEAFTKPNEVKAVTSSAGNKVMNRPWIMPPMMAPRRPPTTFPKIPAVPPAKKLVNIPGRMTASPKTGIKNMPMTVPMVVVMKPKMTAFGENGNKTGQSSAGFAFGTSFIAIPRKAGTISPSKSRTPASRT